MNDINSGWQKLPVGDPSNPLEREFKQIVGDFAARWAADIFNCADAMRSQVAGRTGSEMRYYSHLKFSHFLIRFGLHPHYYSRWESATQPAGQLTLIDGDSLVLWLWLYHVKWFSFQIVTIFLRSVFQHHYSFFLPLMLVVVLIIWRTWKYSFSDGIYDFPLQLFFI